MNLALDERMALLPDVPASRVVKFGWLTTQLTATEAARERLHRWTAAGLPDGDAGALAGSGDISILVQARDVLAWLPPPCVWYISHNCTVIGVGRDTGGWCGGAARLLGCRIIALPGTATDDVILHEYAHGYLHGQDDEPRAMQSVDGREKTETAVEDFAAEFGREKKAAEIRERQAEQTERTEKQANALARTWRSYHERTQR